RHSSIHSGSSFLPEMNLMMSSSRPLGALSVSIEVSNPYLYWSTSIVRTCSIVSCTAGIGVLHPCRSQGPAVADVVCGRGGGPLHVVRPQPDCIGPARPHIY